MAVDENMLSSEMAVEMRRIKRAMGQRDAANKRSIARGAGTSIDIEDAMAKDDTRRSLGKQAASRVASGTRTPVKSTPKTTSTNNPATMSRSSRRMYSGLLENAPKKEAPAPAPTKSSGVRTSRSGGGDYPFTKSEPTSVKTTPSTAAGMGSLAMNAAKVLGPIGVLAATQQAAGATPSDEASMMEQVKMNPKSFYNTKGPGSVKSAYAGQSNLSKLMGVGKKGK